MATPKTSTGTLQKFIAIRMFAVLVDSLTIWFVTNRPHPAIFLRQCANLIRKIQSKIADLHTH